MGTVYKKTFTKPLPAGAEIFTRKGERFARWKPAKGKARTAPLTVGKNGTDRIVVTAGTYTAKYRDGSGVVQEKATGCRDKEAAGRVLTDLERRAELVKAKVITVAEDSIADHQDVSIAEHVKAYLIKLEADETSADHRANVRRCLERIANACGFGYLTDLKREALEKYLASRTKQGISARTRNLDRTSIIAFCNWCIETDRLLINPFVKVKRANEEADRRKVRRSLTEDELARLLYVAHLRPLAEYGRETVHKSKQSAKGKNRATWTAKPLAFDTIADAAGRARGRLKGNPEFLADRERLGRERAMIYKAMVLTGLRKKELTTLTTGQLDLDANPAFLTLDAANEKNREGNSIPIRSDLAADLRGWLKESVEEAHKPADVLSFTSAGKTETNGAASPSDRPIFRVPRDLYRILDNDLAAAGIPKTDERGRTVDVHALRHSFGTLLSRAGVAPRTAQAAMRHSSLDLTMNTYTDPKLLDVAEAIESLPNLPLRCEVETNQAVLSATGTEDKSPSKIAPVLAPKLDKPCKSLSSVVKMTAEQYPEETSQAIVVSACGDKRKQPSTTLVNGCLKERETGFEPATSSLGS
ncbi:MAG: site-specific integrase [Pirellulales bacterium]|nr:site-specific integrase [Pirellulales bacterium]